MKKITLISLFLALAIGASAQYGSKEQKSGLRTVLDIEKQMLTDNSDSTATTLIQDHKKAKKAMTARLMKADGYGKIKKDKPSMDKFRGKLVKKDPRFAAVESGASAAEAVVESIFLPVEIEAPPLESGGSALAHEAEDPPCCAVSAQRVDFTLSDGRRILVEGPTALSSVVGLIQGLTA